MKKLRWFIFALPVVLFACDETLDTDLGPNELTVNNQALVFEALGDSSLIEVSYKGVWSIQAQDMVLVLDSNKAYLKGFEISPISGNGNSRIQVRALRDTAITYEVQLHIQGDTTGTDVTLRYDALAAHALPAIMAQDSSLSIFVAAMKLTGFDKKLRRYQDSTYAVDPALAYPNLGYPVIFYGPDSNDPKYNPYTCPATRDIAYTGFVEKNSVYRTHGIESVQDLIYKLKNRLAPFDSYDPHEKVTYDDNYGDTTNVLYRYIAYHFVNRRGLYDDWTAKPEIIDEQAIFELLDPQEFYETMCPFTMVKMQKNQQGELYLNRRRVNEGALADRNAADPYMTAVAGARVCKPAEMASVNHEATNGVYHYIDNILQYNNTTVTNVLNTRIRMDATTLSPDFMNSGAKGSAFMDGNRRVNYLFKYNYVKGFSSPDSTTHIKLVNAKDWNSLYQMDVLYIYGRGDISIQLPPVPEGEYEIRLGTKVGSQFVALQAYFDGVLCLDSLSLIPNKTDPKIGCVDDTDDETVNDQNDALVKANGFMKGMDSWYFGLNKIYTHRSNSVMRVMLAKVNISGDKIHTLRLKNILEPNSYNYGTEFYIDYLELCPKSVYDAPEGEDRH